MKFHADSEPVLPVEQLFFCGDFVKIGRFDCQPEHACFACTAPLNNDLFVFTHKPLWWRRGDGEYRFAEPGAALLHRAGGAVERREVGMAGDLADWYGIHPDVFEEALDRHRLHDLKVTEKVVTLVTDPGFRLREHQLVSGLQQDSLTPPAIEEAVLTLFDQVCAGLSARGFPAKASTGVRIRRQRLADRARILLDHLENSRDGRSNDMSLSDIARSVGTSVYHLCRVFRAECGLTMHTYRQRQRLGRAIALMQSSHQDLTTLAHDLGYSSHSHFTREFRHYVGCSPSTFNTA